MGSEDWEITQRRKFIENARLAECCEYAKNGPYGKTTNKSSPTNTKKFEFTLSQTQNGFILVELKGSHTGLIHQWGFISIDEALAWIKEGFPGK